MGSVKLQASAAADSEYNGGRAQKKDVGKSKEELNLFAGFCLAKWGQERGVQDNPLQNISASQKYFNSQKSPFYFYSPLLMPRLVL